MKLHKTAGMWQIYHTLKINKNKCKKRLDNPLTGVYTVYVDWGWDMSKETWVRNWSLRENGLSTFVPMVSVLRIRSFARFSKLRWRSMLPMHEFLLGVSWGVVFCVCAISVAYIVFVWHIYNTERDAKKSFKLMHFLLDKPYSVWYYKTYWERDFWSRPW